ncbi:MAG TPA: ribosome-associated translation inhibitor RaiA [Bacteroidetes bacterium]|nr:ribosome-associated translation inhibitor RaiA [Bacteroidota bacterium]
MNIYITARHFKAHETLRAYAFDSLNKMEKYYDGILSADLILSFEKSRNSIKAAELVVKVQGSVLKALEKTDDYIKSIDAAVIKVERQLEKYKSKHEQKDKKVIRKTREKI